MWGAFWDVANVFAGKGDRDHGVRVVSYDGVNTLAGKGHCGHEGRAIC